MQLLAIVCSHQGLLEINQEFLGCFMDQVLGRIVTHSIREHETNIVRYFLSRRICQSIKTSLDGSEVHRFFDDLMIIQKPQSLSIDRGIEQALPIVRLVTHEPRKNQSHRIEFRF
jgi:hypothetical protein